MAASSAQVRSKEPRARKPPYLGGLSAALLVAVLVVAGTLYLLPYQPEKARQWVEHTNVVLLTAERLLTVLDDAETSQRGYLLTLKASYLEPYEHGIGQARTLLAQLHQLTTDNPAQEQRLARLDKLVNGKLSEFANTISLARGGDVDRAIATVRTDVGKHYMDAIRQSLSVITAKEERLLTERQLRERTATRRLQLMLALLGLAVLALILALMVSFIRRATFTARQEGDARFRILADELPTLCWMANVDGWIFWYNRRWYEYTGTTQDQMEGWGWQSVHDPKILPQVLERWKDSIATGKPFEMTFPLRGADGIFRPFLTRITPLHAADGSIVRWFGTNTDVTDERRHAETLERMVEERTAALLREVEERRLAEETLRQSEKLQLIGQFTGGIAHDFNNVLQVVLAAVGLLKSPRMSHERKARVLDEMERAAQNAREMVTRLLAFARKQPLNPQPFDANERLHSMAELLRGTLGSTIEIRTDFASDLWPVLADPNQFEVALLNIAVNARDAMPLGGTLTLRTRNEAAEGTTGLVRISVEDTGTGMPSGVRARIFEPFFTTKEAGKGTGLGLSQVLGFAKQSGGDVTVDSEPGFGTTVTLCLPRAMGGAVPTDASGSVVDGSQNMDSGPAIARASGKVVLVVDDHREVAAFAATMLEGLGYAVRQASSAPEALALLDAGEQVDIVFSDVVMPGHINGAELAGILFLRYPRVGVVMATGYTDQRDRLSGIPVEVLSKPYALERPRGGFGTRFEKQPLGARCVHN